MEAKPTPLELLCKEGAAGDCGGAGDLDVGAARPGALPKQRIVILNEVKDLFLYLLFWFVISEGNPFFADST